MNDLCADIGWRSLNKKGEQLCGDHVDVIRQDNSEIVVLADGMGQRRQSEYIIYPDF